MTEPQGQTTAGGEGPTCGSCGAALAADQRYCLNCGERRGGPRVEYRERLAPSARGGAAPEPGEPRQAPLEAPAGSAPAARRQRDYAPLAAAGGIAVLGIMLLIGVLIGRGTGSTASEGQVPQVVTVESGGAAAAGAAGGAESEGGGGEAAAKSSGKGSGKSKKGSTTAAGTGDAPVASDQDLAELQGQSPEEYQESSAKLPDEIATPGAAPPTDGKAPGGGEGGTTIE